MMDLFIKARYIHKEDALNEGADVLFSSINLENYGLVIPSYVYDIENYIFKEIGRSRRERGGLGQTRHPTAYGDKLLTEREHGISFKETAASQKGPGMRHPRKMIEIANADDWNNTKDDKRKRKLLLDKIYRWHFQSIHRPHTKPTHHTQHPLEELGFFQTSPLKLNNHSDTPLGAKMVQQLYGVRCGELDNLMLDAEKRMPKYTKSETLLGNWDDSINSPTHEKMKKIAYDKYIKDYEKRFDGPSPSQLEFMHHKLYELKGIPRDVLFDTLYDEHGSMNHNSMKNELVTYRKYAMGVLPLMLGIPMLEREDQFKVIEWLFDGAGAGEPAPEGEPEASFVRNGFDDKKLIQAFGGMRNARGFIARNTKLFMQSLYHIYSKNNSSIVAGRPSIKLSEGFSDNRAVKRSEKDGVWTNTHSPHSLEGKRAAFKKDPQLSHDMWKKQFGGFTKKAYYNMVADVIGVDNSEKIKRLSDKKSNGWDKDWPDFEGLNKRLMLSKTEIDEIQNHIVETAEHGISFAQHHGMIDNYNHAYRLVNHDFKPEIDEVVYERTPVDEMLACMSPGLGSLHRGFYEFSQALNEAFPNLIYTMMDHTEFKPQPVVTYPPEMKDQTPATQSWGYTKDMSPQARNEHKNSLRRVMEKEGFSEEEINYKIEELEHLDINNETAKKVRLQAYQLTQEQRDENKTHSEITAESMKLPDSTPEQSQQSWAEMSHANPDMTIASPGFMFLSSTLPFNVEYPEQGILAPDADSGALKDSIYSFHPDSTIKAFRANALRLRDDGRTFFGGEKVYNTLLRAHHGAGVYTHALHKDAKKEDIEQQVALTQLLVAGSHIHPSNYTEDDYENHLKRRGNTKLTFVDEDGQVATSHKDVLGRESPQQMIQELTGREPDYGVSIYDLDDYMQAQTKLHSMSNLTQDENISLRNDILEGNGVLKLKPLNDKSFNSMGDLISGVKNHWRDADGNNLDESGRTKEVIESLYTDKKQVGMYHNDDGELRRYIIQFSPEVQYDEACKMMREKARDAYKEGNRDLSDMYQIMYENQAKYAHDTIMHNPIPSHDEHQQMLIDHAHDTHSATLLAMKAFMPIIEFTHPDAFKTGTPLENNQTIANLAIAYQHAESFMRNQTPEDREHFLTKGEIFGNRYGKTERITVAELLKNIPDSQHLIDKIVNFKSERLTYQKAGKEGLENAKEYFKRHETTDRKTTGGEVLEGFVEGEIGRKNKDMKKDYKIVKEVFDKVREVCNKKNDNGELITRLYARYWPHDADTKNPFHRRDERMFYLSPKYKKSKKMVLRNKFQNQRLMDKGGHHHNHKIDVNTGSPISSDEDIGHRLLSGGESIESLNKGIKSERTQGSELRALNNVLNDIKSQTAGTKYCMTVRDNFGLFGKKGQSLNQLPKKMAEVFDFLHKETKLIGLRGKKPAATVGHSVGGRHPNNAPLPPIATCASGITNMGYEVKTNFSMRDQHFPHAMMIDDTSDDKFHQANATRKAVVPMNLLRDAQPGLLPYDDSVYDNLESQPIKMDAEQGRDEGGPNMDLAASQQALNASSSDSSSYIQHCFDRVTDDTLITKSDGRPIPIKSMHRIFDLEDLKHLRGFSGDWIASHIPQGEPIILQKKGKKSKAYNADMKIIELSDDVSEEMSKINDKDFLVHAVLKDDIVYFIDLLEAADEKTHNMPAKDRVRHLRSHFESSEHIKMPEPFNTKRSDDEGLQHAIQLLRDESSSDILLRDAAATYMRGEIRHPKWVLLSEEKKVDVIVLDRKGTNYQIGVGPLINPEIYGKRAKCVEEKWYMDIGSATGPRGYDIGEYITVFCTGVSVSGKEHPVYKLRSARIDRDCNPQATDSVETLTIMSGDINKIPHRARLKKGKIHIELPALDEEVIYKIQDVGDAWALEFENTLWGDSSNNYLFRLAEDMRPIWQPLVNVLLKRENEVKPETPAGHTKKPKKVLNEEEEIIKRGLELVERGLEHLSKEKITSTGIQGLGINFAGADVESPRGPTTNMNDDTLPDFDPASREYKEKPAEGAKKTRIRATDGQEATTDNRGNVVISEPRG